MFEHTIKQAVNDAVGVVVDRAEPRFVAVTEDAVAALTRIENRIFDQLDFGLWLISGAIVAGCLLAALVIRVGGD
jgi:hypothetical protein